MAAMTEIPDTTNRDPRIGAAAAAIARYEGCPVILDQMFAKARVALAAADAVSSETPLPEEREALALGATHVFSPMSTPHSGADEREAVARAIKDAAETQWEPDDSYWLALADAALAVTRPAELQRHPQAQYKQVGWARPCQLVKDADRFPMVLNDEKEPFQQSLPWVPVFIEVQEET